MLTHLNWLLGLYCHGDKEVISYIVTVFRYVTENYFDGEYKVVCVYYWDLEDFR